MLSEFVSTYKEKSSLSKKQQISQWNRSSMKSKEVNQKLSEQSDEQMARLADRALLLLSFKDTSTQNLRYVLNVLGIRTVEEKKNILNEIFRLIREGIVYVPRGLPQLIDLCSPLNINNSSETENIDLCLLRPYEQLIKEIQNEVFELQTIFANNNPRGIK